jgi:16S rRNA (cytosine967-C5)-methyltransferase
VVPPVSGRPASARDAALEALSHADRGQGFLRDELHALFESLALDPRDRALALQLAAGTVRHRRTLRLILSHVRGERGRGGSIQPHLRDILELGAFQLLYLDRVPAYAAINEAVEQARRASSGGAAQKAAGFVNGMLRGVGRLVVGHQNEEQPARDALPHPEGGAVRLKEPVLPDPVTDHAAYLGAAYSFPDWLVEGWLAAYGNRTEAICRWNNRRPRIFARVRAAAGDALADLPISPGPRPGSIDVSDVPAARLEPLLAAGVLAVQDPSAMAPVEALAPRPGEAILDLCASPGTKTMQIAEAMEDRGRIVACDRHGDKLRPIRQAAEVRGLKSVTLWLSDDAARAAPEGGFDGALVDAPCSNTGVLARRPEARWRLRPEDLTELTEMQLGLLARAAAVVRVGGRIVYSTCSIQPEENDGILRKFLTDHPGWQRVRSDLVLPGADHDGAFWALLTRSA